MMRTALKINSTKLNFSNKIQTLDENIVLLNSFHENNKMVWQYKEVEIVDNYSQKGDFVLIKRNIKINKTNNYKIKYFINHPLKNYEVFIPGVMYKDNRDGKGKFPRIGDEKYWSFDESRMSIPGAIQLSDKDSTLIFAHRSNKLHLSSCWSEDSVSFTLPSKEGPYSYTGKDTLEKADMDKKSSFILLEEGKVINQEFVFYIGNNPCKDSTSHYLKYVENFPSLSSIYKPEISNSDFIGLLLRHLLFLVEENENGYFLKMGKGNGEYQNVYDFTSASFLVKSIEAASIFSSIDIKTIKKSLSEEVKDILEAEEEKVLKDLSYKQLAEKIGDYFLQAQESKGIFRDCQDLNKNIWGGYLGIGENDDFRYNINARTNGEAILSYLNLKDNCDRYSRENYSELIDNVVEFYLTNQLENGNYGRWWTEDSSLVDDKGTNGGYIFLLFIKYYQKTKRKDLLLSIKKAAPYYASLVERGDFFGDTLDAESFDKEAGQILLRSFLALYELDEFNTPYYLELCKKCANYITTWIQVDNIYFDKSTPLGKRDFKTKGMTSVSIANQHLDFYGMMIAYDFLKLHKYCNEEIYSLLAKNMIHASKQLVSTPKDLLGRDKEFYGWLPEQINHTRWDYFSKKSRLSGYFYINIAWVQVLVLNYLLKIEEEFPEVIE